MNIHKLMHRVTAPKCPSVPLPVTLPLSHHYPDFYEHSLVLPVFVVYENGIAHVV